MTRKLEDDLDALYRLPLAEFIGGRKTLAARLKQDGQANEAERVKLLAKPPISAWTVNQLYWKHREPFEWLLATGQRFRKAQTSGKVTDMRNALDARREALAQLSELATTLLRDAGHNPSLDTIRRITTTLEAMSAYASLPDGASPGRLTKDIDPPGFESLASFIPSAGTAQRTAEPARVSPSKGSGSSSAKMNKKTPVGGVSRLEETRQVRIAAAKVSLQNAKKSLVNTRARAQSLEAEQKKVDAAAKEAEKHRREAEERFKKASTASEDAVRRARNVAVDVEEATKALQDAKRTVEKATKELESLFRAG
jgi:hypothetical protein